MVSLTVKKGYHLNSCGKPEDTVIKTGNIETVALTPSVIPFIKPKLLVKKGDHVKIGSPLFIDKRQPDIQYLSPAGGEVEDIRLGPRRIIEEIRIKIDKEEEARVFPVFSLEDIEKAERSALTEALISGGSFQLFRQFPYGDMPATDETPSKIYVCLDHSDYYHVPHEVYLKGREDLFRYGMSVVGKLAEEVICYAGINRIESRDSTVSGFLTHQLKGHYPADDPHVVLYHTKTTAADNRSWYITGQDLLGVAALLKNGRFPTDRFFSVTGDYPGNRGYVKSRMGVPVRELTRKMDQKDDYKFIAGGLFKGMDVSYDTYMGMFETSLYVLPKGDHKEMFGFLRPGYNKPGRTRTFLSVFNKGPFKIDGNQHGELRPCINCSLCADICPVDILPQFAMKAIHAGEVEEALSHGILDCAECGLCTYVCPSKIELADIIKQAKRDYYREIS